jgi:SulP family sulfate permease
MARFQDTILALSLTDSDEGLLRYAALVARQSVFERLHVVHVAPAVRRGAAPVADAESYVARLREAVSRHFDAPADLSYEVVAGHRLDQILGVAIERRADLILLGHRRQHGGRRALARRLAMVSPCAIWMVPEGSPDRVDAILAPVDFSSHSADSLSEATGLAEAFGLASCLALHVFFDPSTLRYDEHVEAVRGEQRQAFDQFIAPVACHGIPVDPVFEESSRTAQAIIRVAQRHEANLIVMGTRGRSTAAAILLGSVTSQTMARTPVPLLAIKHFGSRMSMFEALLNHRFWEQPAPKTS